VLRSHNGERKVSSAKGVGKTRYHMQKSEIGPLSYSICEYQLKMNYRLKTRPKFIKLLENSAERLVGIDWQ
jgi:hypothetical protein